MKMSNGDDKYIEAVINDFSKNDSLFNNHKVFGLAKREVLQYVKKSDSADADHFKMINGQPYLGLMHINLRVNPLTLSEDSKTKIGSKGITIPSRFIIKNEKLFFWWDENYPFTKEAFDVFKAYGIITDKATSRDRYDESTKGRHYYFCGSNYSKFLKLNLDEDISSQNNVHLLCD